MDLYDSDYSIAVLSRDNSMQYRAEQIEVRIESIEKARTLLAERFESGSIGHQDDTSKLFELFKPTAKEREIHPHFNLLNSDDSLYAAKQVIQEVSYHYK